MNEIFIVKVDLIDTMTVALILYWIGITLCRRLSFLQRYNVPPAVVGGLLFAVLRLMFISKVDFEFDTLLMDPFMQAFFATIGLGASAALLKKGGTLTVKLLAAAIILLLLQDAAAIAIGRWGGLHPLIAMLAGSPTMTGGHGTGFVFAEVFEKSFGLHEATEVAFACASYGIIAGSLLGGPVADSLIARHSLAKPAFTGEKYRESVVVDVFNFGDSGEEATPRLILMTIFQITFAVSVGIWFNEWIETKGVFVPAYAVALLAGIILRNVGDHVRLFRVHPRIVNYISGACLSFFLAMALMMIDLRDLSDLAMPLIMILLVQTLLMIVFAYFVTFKLVGGDYQASVITAGHIGFGLGGTANAVANMEAVCARYGSATDAFFAVAAVGAFFIDIVNVFVINVLVKILV